MEAGHTYHSLVAGSSGSSSFCNERLMIVGEPSRRLLGIDDDAILSLDAKHCSIGKKIG